jgi:hypothetical protein
MTEAFKPSPEKQGTPKSPDVLRRHSTEDLLVGAVKNIEPAPIKAGMRSRTNDPLGMK